MKYCWTLCPFKLVFFTEPGVDGPPSIGVTSAQAQREASRLEFSKFDVARVLEQGASLLGSAGSEYELEVDVGTYQNFSQFYLFLCMIGLLITDVYQLDMIICVWDQHLTSQ